MKRMLAGILVALPLLVVAMPKQASALVIGRHHHHRRWVPGHSVIRHHHRVWIRGHYE